MTDGFALCNEAMIESIGWDPRLHVLGAVRTPSGVCRSSRAPREVSILPLMLMDAVGPSLGRLAGSGHLCHLTPSSDKHLSSV